MKYDRQTGLIGEDGQKKLSKSTVSVIGAGGLGSPVLTYLACSGVGNLRVIDKDIVDITNLNRQFLYTKQDIGKSKAKIACEKLRAYEVSAKSFETEITKKNIHEILNGSDLVLDCVDNIATRLIVNEYCVTHNIPFVEAGIDGMYGFVTCVSSDTACLNCMGFSDKIKKEKVPVLGTTAGVIGTIQANEGIKILLGMGDVLYSKMLQYDGYTASFEIIDLEKSDDCKYHK